MNTLISLKSRIINEALYDLLKREGNGDNYFLIEHGNAGFDCRPDVIVVDNESLNHGFVSKWPEAKLILLDTGLAQDVLVTLLLTYMLHGILSPDTDISLMRRALKAVHAGQIWIDNDCLKALLCEAGIITKNGGINKVSNREQQILDQIALGRKNKEIAAQLFLSEQTVKAHLCRIFKKFNVSSRTQLLSLLNRTP
jgi:DNA-binding NarL/FixJ family response regulator